MGRRASSWVVLALALAASEPSHTPRVSRGHHVTVGLAAIGRDGSMDELDGGASAVIAGAEVHIARAPGVMEWWRSAPTGLEQGVTIDERALGAGALWLEMTVGDGVAAELVSQDEVLLRDAGGELLARYAHLVVHDVTSARIPARLAVAGRRIRIEVDDANARYPLVVDPLLTIIEEATLLEATPAMADRLGVAVAITQDGSRAIAGAYTADVFGHTDQGNARVFVRTGSTWAPEATLNLAVGWSFASFGTAVAVTDDGTRALVGAPNDAFDGSAHVFVRSGSTWTEEATLLASDRAMSDGFGASVAFSADGTRALVGAYVDDTAGGMDAGSAHVFVRSGSTWSEEAILVAFDGAAMDYFGRSVALSSDGVHALIGVDGDDTVDGANCGSARAFVRVGSTWTEEATLLASSPSPGDDYGKGVALSSDGSRALVAAHLDNTAAGAAAGSVSVYVRAGSSWSQEAVLFASDAAASDQFGSSVALTPDGTLALIGAQNDDVAGVVDAGSAHVFVRAGSTWADQGMAVAPDGAMGDYFGYSGDLTSDGSRAIVGAFDDDVGGLTDAGSARVFTITAAGLPGTPCSVGVECLNGLCVDAFCCDTACGGGNPTDCQACAMASTGLADGTCGPVASSVALVCRAASDLCDVPETCDGASIACPGDALAPTTHACRPQATPCDSEESCTGASAACPTDRPASAGTTCRATLGACDPAEVCDGLSFACPGDVRLPAGAVCRSIADVCDVEERCTGAAAACPPDVVLPAGASCRPAVGPCDSPDTCDGTSVACVDAFQPAGTVCNGIISDVCDAPDHCTGSTGNCPAEYLSGVECRASSGACDLAEVCAGTSPTCPPDAIAGAGLSCRASTDPSCDPEETCDGVARACPADVTTCAARPDAGRSADSGMPDAGVTPDAGPPVATGGCCRAAGGRGATPGAALCALTLLAAGRRRRATRPRTRAS